MIECIATVDYEIYGNGEGSLRDLIYDPAERLMAIFKEWNARFVAFIEAAELEMIERNNTDRLIHAVRRQIRELHKQDFEVGLHLHPQWYNARYEKQTWILDYGEYNLCSLPRGRIAQIVGQALAYLRDVTGEPDFTPLAFRAGNWLFQPTSTAAEVLAEEGIKIDSSVFKGGFQYQHALDYRNALRNGYYWRFSDEVETADPRGLMLELPIHTSMVPFWRMFTGKRVGIQRKHSAPGKNGQSVLRRLPDFLRLRYPLKLDFCRMTVSELRQMIDTVIQEDRKDPAAYRPLVAIGHTKDLMDFKTVENFLSLLKSRKIALSTFKGMYAKCGQQ